MAPDAPYYDRGTPPPPRRQGFGCILSLASALFGAIVGAGLIALLLLALFGLPKSGSTGTTSSGNITINTQDEITFAEAVAKKATPSVVLVGVEQTGTDPHTGNTVTQIVGNGSGVIIRQDGYILTNDHVVADAQGLLVQIDGDQVPAEVVGTDPSSDLAVIKIDRTGLTAIEMGSSKNLQVGQPVVAIGSPFGLDQTVTSGIISALGRSSLAENAGAQVTAYTSLIQTDAAINPGNSGGALCDAQGKLIGINTLIQTGGTDQSAGVGFAIPVDYAKQIADELISTGTATHPFLGVSTLTVTPAVAQQFNLSVNTGALVDSVQPGSPADKAGIQSGDVIVKIGSKDITGVEDVFAAVRSQKVGDTVKVEVVRGGNRQTLEATLVSDANAGQ
jgi:putative serine protease PepD